VVGGRWVGPYMPLRGGLSLWLSGRPVGRGPGRDPMGPWSTGLAGLSGMGPVEIMLACGLQAWWG
jgi:hypothetical protein